MPSYKTHAIHSETVLPNINLRTNIETEDLKVFSMGPDAVMPVNPFLFRLQHTSKTREFFITLINMIKEKKLYDNGEIMAFLYGQLEHFVLDLIMHPLVYYMTEGLPRNHILNAHSLLEHAIDDYVIDKYAIGNGYYYDKLSITDNETYELINELYEKVYGASNVGIQYTAGIVGTKLYDSKVRLNKINTITSFLNLGDVKYHGDPDIAKPYLNLDHNIWFNPETGIAYNYSFDDLWNRASELLLETIDDVNNYIYLDKPLTNTIILNNTSYLTGIPCELGQSKIHYKKYK